MAASIYFRLFGRGGYVVRVGGRLICSWLGDDYMEEETSRLTLSERLFKTNAYIHIYKLRIGFRGGPWKVHGQIFFLLASLSKRRWKNAKLSRF